MNKTQNIWIARQVLLMICFFAVIGTAVPVMAQELVYSHQSIPTKGALDWESFVIDGNTYLAVANYFNGITTNVDSVIYKWDGNTFIEFQSITTNGAIDWESFIIGDDIYLAVANYYGSGSTSHNVDSVIYKWDGSAFIEFQSIPTHGARDWASFTIDGTPYLALANEYDGVSYNIDSKIFRWNGSQFVEFQSIPSYGARDWEQFTIDGNYFLALANNRSNATYNVDSKIYFWTDNMFVETQSIRTNGANDWESFTIDGKRYLSVANAYNGSTYNINSVIYAWEGFAFKEIQQIPTNGAVAWESFSVDGKTYLAVANWYNNTSYNLYSKIYQWSGYSFIEKQSISTNGACDWESFPIDGQLYLAVANEYNGSSYSINSEIFRMESPIADAAGEYMTFETARLDGSNSHDFNDGWLVAWQWTLTSRANPETSITTTGEVVEIEDLAPGFYDIVLKVTDNDGLTDTDDTLLAVFGLKGDFDQDGDVDGDDLSGFAQNFGW